MTDEHWNNKDQTLLDDEELPDEASYKNAQRDPRTGSPQRPLTSPEDHEHVWKFSHTYESWWDGDEDDIYKCTVAGCKARDNRYVGR